MTTGCDGSCFAAMLFTQPLHGEVGHPATYATYPFANQAQYKRLRQLVGKLLSAKEYNLSAPGVHEDQCNYIPSALCLQRFDAGQFIKVLSTSPIPHLGITSMPVAAIHLERVHWYSLK